MLTRQGMSPIYNWLPNELLHEIICCLTNRSDLATMCLVSKLFRTLATKQLYSSVHLSDDFEPDKEGQETFVFDLFQRTVSTNPALASAVKNIRIE